MKNNMIREGWDTVNPTQAQRERMRAALEAHLEASEPSIPKRTKSSKILELEERPLLDFTLPEDPYRKQDKQTKEDTKKTAKAQPRYYSRGQSRSSRGLVSSVIAAMLMVAVAAGLFLAVMMDRQNAPIQADQPTQPQQTSWEETATGVKAYDEILGKYRKAIEENWAKLQYAEAGLSPAIAEGDAADALGWCLMDVDGDGQEELLISDGQYIYDAYTAESPLSFAQSSEDAKYQLCMDGIFFRQYSQPDSPAWVYYKLVDGLSMKQEKTIVYKDGQYYAGVTEASVAPITKDEAGDLIVSAYPRASVPVTLFCVGQRGLPMAYEKLIDKYTTAIQEKWDGSRCAEEDISILMRNAASLSDLGYSITDLDGDGHDELLITDGKQIYDLYTRFQFTDRMLTQVFSAWDRNRYELCDLEGERILVNQGSSSAAESSCYFFRLEHGALIAKERLDFNSDENPQNPWMHYKPEDLINGAAVTEEKANEIIASYPVHEIAFIPFGQAESGAEEQDAALLAMYAKAIPEAYDGYSSPAEKTFCFYDIDEDGKDELLLGSGEMIYQILQPKAGDENGVDFTALVGNEGYAIFCEGNVIHCQAYAQGSYHHQFVKLRDTDGKITTETVDYVFYAPETDHWYLGGPGINTPITETEGKGVIDAHPTAELPWKPLEEFPVPLEDVSVKGSPLFEKVFMPIATEQVGHRMEDVTKLLKENSMQWREAEGILECKDPDMEDAVLICYMTNKNGYVEFFDVTYIANYGSTTDCRKATVSFLYGRDYYIGTDAIIYVGAKAEDAEQLRNFVFTDDDDLMLRVLASQFAEAYFSRDEIYMRQATGNEEGYLDMFTGKAPNRENAVIQIKGLPLSEKWQGEPVTLSVVCMIPPDTDSYSYLVLEFEKENGAWKITFYGMEK